MSGLAVHGRVRLGSLTVGRIGLGTTRLCGGPGAWGPPVDRAGALRVLRRAAELGVTLVDTADTYGPGVAEELVAEALAPYPPELVVATKVGSIHRAPDHWEADGRPEHLRRAVAGSLRRLRLETIPLVQLHRVDARVPIEESVGALSDLRREGKIAEIGVSNVTVAQLEAAVAAAPVVSAQNHLSVASRTHEEVLRACERLGLALIAYAPLDGGALAADAQHALRSLLALSPAIVAIPGVSSVTELEENAGA